MALGKKKRKKRKATRRGLKSGELTKYEVAAFRRRVTIRRQTFYKEESPTSGRTVDQRSLRAVGRMRFEKAPPRGGTRARRVLDGLDVL